MLATIESKLDNIDFRLVNMESFLHIPNISKNSNQSYPAITLIIDTQFHNNPIPVWENSQGYVEDESDYHVFIQILSHNVQNIEPRIQNYIDHHYDKYIFVLPLYSVLIIKHSDLSIIDNLDSRLKMNTQNTLNFNVQIGKQLTLFFGYSNTDEDLNAGDNIFLPGKENGVFFIMNDVHYRKVENYSNENPSIIQKIAGGLYNNFLDIYKATTLEQTNFEFSMIT